MMIRELHFQREGMERKRGLTIIELVVVMCILGIMVLIAIPFSFMMGNRGTLYGIGIAVGISMVFWGAIGIFSALGSTTVLSPFLSAFAPLFLFAALSIYLFVNIKT